MSDLESLRAYLAQQDDVALAYLFGSRVSDHFALESDHDIAVLTRPLIPPARRYQLTSELSAVLGGAPVDLLVLNQAPVELTYAVIAHGDRVFERDVTTRVEFEVNVMSRYADCVYTLREQRADLIRGGRYEAGVRRNRAALGQTERVLAEIRAAARQNG